MDGTEGMGCLVPADHKDRRESKEWQVPLAHGMVEWSTQGGGKQPVQVLLELSWYTPGGLAEASTVTQGVGQTTSACLATQTTSNTDLEFKGAMCLAQSMRHNMENHSHLSTNAMLPVQFAMLR